MKILAIIPARSGSKKVVDKNIRDLNNKPLIYYSIHEAKKSKFIDRVIVSTDSQKYADIAIQLGAEVPFLRDESLGGDMVKDLPVIKFNLDKLKKLDNYIPEIIVWLRPTAPLRKVEHIDQAISFLLQNFDNVDSLRSVTAAPKHPQKMWVLKNKLMEPFMPKEYRIPEGFNFPRQELDEVYVQNGNIEVIKRDTVLVKNSFTGSEVLPFIMDENVSVNIDTELDFLMAELIMKKEAYV